MDQSNPLGMRGIKFTEFRGPTVHDLGRLFLHCGFSKLRHHPAHDIGYFRRNDIHLLLSGARRGCPAEFASRHGPSICSMGRRVDAAAGAETVRHTAWPHGKEFAST